MKITKKLYIAVNQVFKRLSLLRRWTTDMADTQYTEQAKQGLNCLVTFFLASEYEMAGGILDWSKFPKIALYRAFEKAHITYDVSKEEINEICEIGNVPAEKRDILPQIIEEETGDKDFAYELMEAYSGIELQIFTAARTIATYIEMKENSGAFNGAYNDMVESVARKLSEFEFIPNFKNWSEPDKAGFKLIQKISKLRNQVRWIIYAHQKDCSVLGHLFDTGYFAYFMSLEENPDEKVATEHFFIGIFHDVPETWTKDIPSPLKEKMGIRAATEIYENKVVQENIYDKIPSLAPRLKKVMMEDDANASIKISMKGADYLSASRECFFQIQSGTRDYEFYRAAFDLREKVKNGKAKVTPFAMEYYEWLLSKIEKLEALFISEKE